jgi:hypothetical protein
MMDVLERLEIEQYQPPEGTRTLKDDDVDRIVEQLHRVALRTPLHIVADRLQRLLTPQVAADIAGVKDVKTVRRWAKGEVTDPKVPEKERRLRTAFEIVLILSTFDSLDVVRPWFLGINPHLKGKAPAEAIRDGELQEARQAAFAFVAA